MLIADHEVALFPDTCWTRVLAIRSGGGPATDKALEQLCKTYWGPLYSYARRQGNSPEDAEDLTQGFLHHALKCKLLNNADAAIGRLRSYLLGTFRNYMLNEYRANTADKRGGNKRPFSLNQMNEAELEIQQLQMTDGLTPESVYEYDCALALVRSAINRLANEERKCGRERLFEALRPILDGTISNDSQSDIADRLGTTHGAVRQALLRLRRRSRELLREAVRQTLDNPSEADIDDELVSVRMALGQMAAHS